MVGSLTAARARLGTADRLIAEASPDLGGLWPRASAWLLRIALEHASRELWQAVSPRMRFVSVRAQMLVLPKYIGESTAGDCRLLWSELSVVTHHHDYELAPTVQQLRRWQESCERVVTAIDAAIRSQNDRNR